MQSRHSSDNTRKLFNVIYRAKGLPHNPVEKAFNRIERAFLLCTLQKFGFGTNFIQCIKMLYNKPMASVCTNDYISEPFVLKEEPNRDALHPDYYLIWLWSH